MENTDFNLEELMDEVASIFALKTAEKNIELICELAPEVPIQVVGDPGRLRQVICNLTSNAIKFTQSGEIALQVAVERRDGKRTLLHFAVRDTGIGIPPEKQDEIFESFRQADVSTTRKYGGTGLGLAISAQLVQIMNGRIWVESRPECGSCFHFTVWVDVSSAADEAREQARPDTLEGIDALVVDDNAGSRRMLQAVLSGWKARPAFAADARAGLEELKRAALSGHPYRLVLLDSQMPGGDGFAVAEQLRRMPRLAGGIIMMLNAKEQFAEADRCRQLGVSAYLVKPVRRSELRSTIRRLLGESERRPVAESPAEPSKLAGHSLRILVAEDNPVNQRLALRLLEKEGQTVSVANDGREAIRMHAREKFDVILMDIQMPELDGFDTTREIRQAEAATGRHVRIIAMTAYAMEGDQQRCLEAGMDGYIAKPVRKAELITTICECMQSAPAGSWQPNAAPGKAQDSPATS